MTSCCEFAPSPDDLPEWIRHLKTCHPDRLEEIQEAVDKLGQMVRTEWGKVFGGPLAVDFVCNNPAKMALLRATMEISDLVPWVFAIKADENLGPQRVRVIIEI